MFAGIFQDLGAHLHTGAKCLLKRCFSSVRLLFLLLQDENNIQKRETQQLGVTVDDDCCRGAASLGHDVFGHAGVVGRVGEARLLDDQVVVDGDVEVPVVRRVDDLLVLQPLHLRRRRREENGRTALQTHLFFFF